MTKTSNEFRISGRSTGGFTLVELMISIALVVLLILGVSQVFQYTTQAVGAGEAVTAAIRSSRSAQNVFSSDFAAMVGSGSGANDAASLIIGSRAVYAYRDAKDQKGQGAIYTPQTGIGAGLPAQAFRDLNSDGTSGDPNVNGEIILPDNYNYRNHRIDTLSFFARNLFSRQTGNVGTVVDSLSTTEAWIWYGHLWLPDNSANYPFTTYAAGSAYPASQTGPGTFPGAGSSSTNPNNYYANQWVLGRQAILLKEKTTDDQYGLIYDNNSYSQRFIDRINAYPSTAANGVTTYAKEVEPLSSSSQALPNTAAAGSDMTDWYLQDSRFDLAATSISAFRNKLSSYVDSNNTNASLIASQPYWFDWMMDGNIYPPAARIFPANAYTRFKCNPFLTKPMTAVNMAQASPYFLGGCSQFIVEFAGDFLTQDNDPTHTTRVAHSQYGDVITADSSKPGNALAADGQVDFFVNANGAKQIIWYGMPRNTSGKSTTSALNGDVVPVRDWLQHIYNSTTGVAVSSGSQLYASFERYFPFGGDLPGTLLAKIADYNQSLGQGDAMNGYTCAWGPNDVHPKIMLIRITITLEDPTGRLPEGQTFQYVFNVAPASTSN